MRLNRVLSALVVVVAVIVVASFAHARQGQPASAPAEEETVVRTYDVSDLMRVAVDYPLDSKIEPPTGLGYRSVPRDATHSGNLFGGTALIQAKPAPQETL